MVVISLLMFCAWVCLLVLSGLVLHRVKFSELILFISVHCPTSYQTSPPFFFQEQKPNAFMLPTFILALCTTLGLYRILFYSPLYQVALAE